MMDFKKIRPQGYQPDAAVQGQITPRGLLNIQDSCRLDTQVSGDDRLKTKESMDDLFSGMVGEQGKNEASCGHRLIYDDPNYMDLQEQINNQLKQLEFAKEPQVIT